jgi:hypothetical protein
MVTRLGCLRGVSTLTAFGLAVEIGDWHRLTGRTIGAYLGLLPIESSSTDMPPSWGLIGWHAKTTLRVALVRRRVIPQPRPRGSAPPAAPRTQPGPPRLV